MNVVMLGRPGAGKGTQSRRIEAHFGLRHLSTGALLRTAIQRDTSLGELIAKRIDRGNFVTDELAISLVEQALKPPALSGYVFDGVPRTLAQDRMLADLIAGLGAKLDLAIELQVSQEEIRRRLLERATIEGRTDDTVETIEHRLDVFEAETSPLAVYYGERGILRSIDGSGTPDEVFKLVQENLGELARRC